MNRAAKNKARITIVLVLLLLSIFPLVCFWEDVWISTLWIDVVAPVSLSERSANQLLPISVHNPPGDFCMFSTQLRERSRPIYARLEADLRKYSKMDRVQREKLIGDCRNSGGSCSVLSIRGGKIFVSKLGAGIETRHAETLRHLKRVAEKFFPLPDVDFAVDTDDGSSDTGQLPRFMLCGFIHAPQGIMVPDFSFFDYPITKCPGESSHLFRDFIRNATERLHVMKQDPRKFVTAKKNDIFWRGARLNNPTRVDQLDRILKTMSGNAEGYDLKLMEWVSNTLEGNNAANGCVTMHDHCDHRFLLHLQGNTYSSRLKYLLLCGSVVFMPQQEFEEWWYPAFPTADVVDENNGAIVHVRKDVSDIHTQFEKFFHNRHATKRTIETGLRTLELAVDVFSEKNVDCYWGTVLVGASKAWGPILNGTIGRPIEDILENPFESFNDL